MTLRPVAPTCAILRPTQGSFGLGPLIRHAYRLFDMAVEELSGHAVAAQSRTRLRHARQVRHTLQWINSKYDPTLKRRANAFFFANACPVKHEPVLLAAGNQKKFFAIRHIAKVGTVGMTHEDKLGLFVVEADLEAVPLDISYHQICVFLRVFIRHVHVCDAFIEFPSKDFVVGDSTEKELGGRLLGLR